MAYKLTSINKSILYLLNKKCLQHQIKPAHFYAVCHSALNSNTVLSSPRTDSLFDNKLSLLNALQIRNRTYKSNKKNTTTSTEYESDSDTDDEEFLEKERAKTEGVRVVQIQVDNMRADIIIKFAFGISRNKCEVLFYENKIRINGKRPLKKSADTTLNDEVDIIRGVSEDNKNFIVISRVEILRVRPAGDYLVVTIRKQKNMTIENYTEDPWIEKETESAESKPDSE